MGGRALPKYLELTETMTSNSVKMKELLHVLQLVVDHFGRIFKRCLKR